MHMLAQTYSQLHACHRTSAFMKRKICTICQTLLLLCIRKKLCLCACCVRSLTLLA